MTTRGAAARLLGRLRRRTHTLASSADPVSGVGLHSGRAASVRLRPAAADEGVYFVRTDLGEDAPPISASVESVLGTRLSTTLGTAGGATVATVEHLLAALCGAGVSACRVELDGPEVPLLDGSAAPWVAAVRAAGLARQPRAAPAHRPRRPLWVHEGSAWVVALPAAAPSLTYGIDFAGHAPIGRQWFSWAPDDSDAGDGALDRFARDLAPARTFALAEHLQGLRDEGLIRGGSAESALVCDRERWLNGPLRFDEEPARHKTLDLLGDLALLGALPRARIVAYKAGHRMHVALARKLAEEAG